MANYNSYLKRKKYKIGKTIRNKLWNQIYQPKTIEDPSNVDTKPVIIEHPKTSLQF